MANSPPPPINEILQHVGTSRPRPDLFPPGNGGKYVEVVVPGKGTALVILYLDARPPIVPRLVSWTPEKVTPLPAAAAPVTPASEKDDKPADKTKKDKEKEKPKSTAPQLAKQSGLKDVVDDIVNKKEKPELVGSGTFKGDDGKVHSFDLVKLDGKVYMVPPGSRDTGAKWRTFGSASEAYVWAKNTVATNKQEADDDGDDNSAEATGDGNKKPGAIYTPVDKPTTWYDKQGNPHSGQVVIFGEGPNKGRYGVIAAGSKGNEPYVVGNSGAVYNWIESRTKPPTAVVNPPRDTAVGADGGSGKKADDNPKTKNPPPGQNWKKEEDGDSWTRAIYGPNGKKVGEQHWRDGELLGYGGDKDAIDAADRARKLAQGPAASSVEWGTTRTLDNGNKVRSKVVELEARGGKVRIDQITLANGDITYRTTSLKDEPQPEKPAASVPPVASFPPPTYLQTPKPTEPKTPPKPASVRQPPPVPQQPSPTPSPERESGGRQGGAGENGTSGSGAPGAVVQPTYNEAKLREYDDIENQRLAAGRTPPAAYQGAGVPVDVEHFVDKMGRWNTVTTAPSGAKFQQVEGSAPYRISGPTPGVIATAAGQPGGPTGTYNTAKNQTPSPTPARPAYVSGGTADRIAEQIAASAAAEVSMPPETKPLTEVGEPLQPSLPATPVASLPPQPETSVTSLGITNPTEITSVQNPPTTPLSTISTDNRSGPSTPVWHANPNWGAPGKNVVAVAGLDTSNVLEERPGKDGKTIFRMNDGTYQVYNPRTLETSGAGTWNKDQWAEYSAAHPVPPTPPEITNPAALYSGNSNDNPIGEPTVPAGATTGVTDPTQAAGAQNPLVSPPPATPTEAFSGLSPPQSETPGIFKHGRWLEM